MSRSRNLRDLIDKRQASAETVEKLFQRHPGLEGYDSNHTRFEPESLVCKAVAGLDERYLRQLGTYTIVSVENTLKDFEAAVEEVSHPLGGQMEVAQVFQWISRLRVAEAIKALSRMEGEH